MYYETIKNKEQLANNLAQEFDAFSENFKIFVDLTAQNIGTRMSEDFFEGDDSDLNGNDIVWIDGVNSNEGYEIMERFADSRPVKERQSLYRALNKSHPFRVFRYALEELGILQDWYAFKAEAYIKLAKERLDDCDIDVIDGEIVCNNTKLIATYMSRTLEQECECAEEDAEEEEGGED